VTGPDLPARAVEDAMVTAPWTHEVATTVGQALDAFTDSHVHMLLLVHDGVLHGTVVRDDLVGTADPGGPALELATLVDRTVHPGHDLDAAMRLMREQGSRRLAVVDDDRRLVGLLCLKRTLDGFCSDADVDARALERGGVHRIGG
jgi:predicted transcriptional regulator